MSSVRESLIGFGQAIASIGLIVLVSWAIGVWATVALCVTDPPPRTELFGVRLVFGSLALALLVTVTLSVFVVGETVSRFFIRMAARHDASTHELSNDHHRFFAIALRLGVYLTTVMVFLTVTFSIALESVPCFSIRFTMVSWTGAAVALLLYGIRRVCRSLRRRRDRSPSLLSLDEHHV